jgi:putative Mn2+ efflux pump MntP
MDLLILLFVSIGLAMDCLAVSLAVGTRKQIPTTRIALTLALVFGGFQFIMNIMGWAMGEWLIPFLAGFDHWVAFILLAVIGGKMIYDGFKGAEESKTVKILQPATLLLLAVATSIDSLGVGLSFALLAIVILIPALMIGMVSAVFSFAGVFLGNRLAEHFGERMEILGGIILIGIGVRILFGHLAV